MGVLGGGAGVFWVLLGGDLFFEMRGWDGKGRGVGSGRNLGNFCALAIDMCKMERVDKKKVQLFLWVFSSEGVFSGQAKWGGFYKIPAHGY